MVALGARCDARRDKLDVVKVDDVEVLRVEALEGAAHAAAYGVGGVVKVCGGGAVSPDFAQELVGPAGELDLKCFERGAEHDLGVVVVGRGVEGADAVSVCACM